MGGSTVYLLVAISLMAGWFGGEVTRYPRYMWLSGNQMKLYAVCSIHLHK